MRQQYPQFQALGAEVLAIAPDRPVNAADFYRRHPLPFPLLADETHEVFDRYGVTSRWLSLGQRPGVFIVDREGIVRYAHVGAQQWQIPSPDTLLDELQRWR